MTKLLQSKKPRREKDNYPTPAPIAAWVVKQCLELSCPLHHYHFLEPGCGDDAPFANAMRSLAKESCIDVQDIRDVALDENAYDHIGKGIDYLNRKQSWRSNKRQYDIIATNPPFKIALEFWWRSMELLAPSGVLGMVVKLSFLASKRRAEVWKLYPPVSVQVLYPRPSFTGDGFTDIAQEYCAVFWYRPELARVIHRNPLTSMSWVNLKAITGAKHV